ncbi:lipoic acid synthetase [Thermodesulfovibrio aggregans]|uniref:Lipoyl synthase n=1 Tax=Thermodesulfovibrio aggregans TaxID=86166 RepID=A0A0U9HXL1_9BACT|nr:lipoyl synthase [Thermodesulfovibrio aggregans]GAQ94469.1 lipoic acid synthetase [Thermodesulfovibrio aggregans]
MPLPEWVKTQLREIKKTQKFLKNRKLNTVCETLRCPNRGDCYKKSVVTFMILGNVCTRGCKFCNADKGIPEAVDSQEPYRISQAIQELELKYVVITSPTRDDLKDGGAEHFALTVKEIKKINPLVLVEVLVPDFQGDINSVKKVLNSDIAVFAHNVETVPSLYGNVRQGDYGRSLKILEFAKIYNPQIITKSGFMVGVGEKMEEIFQTVKDLKNAGCDIITVGQYLQPSKKALPVVEYKKVEVFDEIADFALKTGIKVVLSAPLIRSSTRAYEAYKAVKEGIYGKL